MRGRAFQDRRSTGADAYPTVPDARTEASRSAGADRLLSQLEGVRIAGHVEVFG